MIANEWLAAHGAHGTHTQRELAALLRARSQHNTAQVLSTPDPEPSDVKTETETVTPVRLRSVPRGAEAATAADKPRALAGKCTECDCTQFKTNPFWPKLCQCQHTMDGHDHASEAPAT
jgi:hypothetical protein